MTEGDDKVVHHYTPGGWVADGPSSVKSHAEKEDVAKAIESLKAAGVDRASEATLLSDVVYSLTWALKNATGNFEGIYCDQWCGVKAKGSSYAEGEEENKEFTTWVECDAVEWGIAKTWLLFVEKFGLEKGEENNGSDRV